MAWLIVFVKGKGAELKNTDSKELVFIIVSVAFSYFVFKEKLSRKAFAGLILIVVGTLAMAIWA